jgi:hypothetical protein
MTWRERRKIVTAAGPRTCHCGIRLGRLPCVAERKSKPRESLKVILFLYDFMIRHPDLWLRRNGVEA